MANLVSYWDIRRDDEINTYVRIGNQSLGVLGYTEHSFVHAGRVANLAAKILKTLDYPEREVELARISGYMHDIGNTINRSEHAQTGAVMAFDILNRKGMPPEEIAAIVSAIGNHHEDDGCAVSPHSAALIIADKSDVRRSRVRNNDFAKFDIHDRVNYAVQRSCVTMCNEKNTITLALSLDTEICEPIDYLEIFMTRMIMSRRAAEFLGRKFVLIINGAKLS